MCQVYISPQIGALSERDRASIVARDQRRRVAQLPTLPADSDDNAIGLADGTWFQWHYNNLYGTY